MQNIQTSYDSTTSDIPRWGRWWLKISAIIALINFILVLFNLSYIPFRDVYIRQIPQVATIYDPVKGIEPHPQTQQYLETVDTLTQQVSKTGLASVESEEILAQLRESSTEMIEENPFLAASKFGTFAKLQRRMKEHTGTDSAKDAFNEFWTAQYLTAAGWQNELTFFNRQIRPLIDSNYYRQVNDYGQFIDDFWLIDRYFIAFFTIEFLVCTFFLSRRHPLMSWLDAMFRRWYDIFLILPFLQALRIISVGVRLHKSRLLSFERVLVQMTHELVVNVADQLSKFIIVRLINQAQSSVRNGSLARSIFYPKPYIQVNDIDEVEAISDRLINLTVNRVLPKVQPDIEALMHHSIESTFKNSEFYRGIRNLPGIGGMPAEAIEQLANYLADASVSVLANSYADTKGRQILEQLSADFKAALTQELQDQETLSELQSLVNDLLEELKLNYVIYSRESGAEETLAEVELLGQAAAISDANPSLAANSPASNVIAANIKEREQQS